MQGEEKTGKGNKGKYESSERKKNMTEVKVSAGGEWGKRRGREWDRRLDPNVSERSKSLPIAQDIVALGDPTLVKKSCRMSYRKIL
jgi:hypothetical protein